jgi:hypothetical protein
MILPRGIKVFGDTDYRGKCPLESAEQATFFNRIRALYPDSYGLTATHIKNEGKRTHNQISSDKAQGMATGAPDIIIPGGTTFICELKRRDHTKSKISDEQVKYLLTSQQCGAYVCIALGVDAAIEAFNAWAQYE